MKTIAPTDDYPFIQLDTPDLNKPREIALFLEDQGVRYVFGGKDFALLHGRPDDLESITGLDCSAKVGVDFWHMTGGEVNLEDRNSQAQGAWAAASGFKPSTPEDATNLLGHLYLFMLPSGASHDGIGHVGFVRNCWTAESYGHHGPGTRPWGPTDSELGSMNPSWAWQQHCKVWVIALGS